MTGKHRNDIDMEVLKHEYLDLKIPTTRLGEKYGCPPETIANKLKRIGVSIRGRSEVSKLNRINNDGIKYRLDKEWLEQKYLIEKLSPQKIADLVGCHGATIIENLKRYGVQLRTMSESARLVDRSCVDIKRLSLAKKKKNGGILDKYKISREELYQKYIIDGRGATDICKDYGCNHRTIDIRLKRYGIEKRNAKESHNMPNYTSKLKLFRHKDNIIYDKLPENPSIGTLIDGKLIGKRFTFIWWVCKRCGIGRWMQMNNFKHSNTDGYCVKCYQWRDEIRKRKSEIHKKRYENIEERRKTGQYAHEVWERKKLNGEKDAYVRNILKGNAMKPTKPENQIIDILNEYYPLEWKYVGDGEIILGGKNPDIININGIKAIIEVNGTYWHSLKYKGECPFIHELNRIEHYNQYGYKTLVVWEHELKHKDKVIKKIQDFYSELSKFYH